MPTSGKEAPPARGVHAGLVEWMASKAHAAERATVASTNPPAQRRTTPVLLLFGISSHSLLRALPHAPKPHAGSSLAHPLDATAQRPSSGRGEAHCCFCGSCCRRKVAKNSVGLGGRSLTRAERPCSSTGTTVESKYVRMGAVCKFILFCTPMAAFSAPLASSESSAPAPASGGSSVGGAGASCGVSPLGHAIVPCCSRSVVFGLLHQLIHAARLSEEAQGED